MLYMGYNMETIVINSEGQEFVSIIAVPLLPDDIAVPIYIFDINENDDTNLEKAIIKSDTKNFINWIILDLP